MSEPNTFELALHTSAVMPEVRIDREAYLLEELTFCCPRETAEEAVRLTPALAGIPKRKVDRVARNAVGYESNKVSTLTFSAGLHAGMSMLGMVPADVTRYMAHMLRVVQKLCYLYGWDMNLPAGGELDPDTAAVVTLFFGVMLDVEGAEEALRTIGEEGEGRVTMEMASRQIQDHGIGFTVKQMTRTLSERLPKEVYGRRISRFIPIIGAEELGGLTYVTYKPMADRMRRFLSSLNWAGPLE